MMLLSYVPSSNTLGWSLTIGGLFELTRARAMQGPSSAMRSLLPDFQSFKITVACVVPAVEAPEQMYGLCVC